MGKLYGFAWGAPHWRTLFFFTLPGQSPALALAWRPMATTAPPPVRGDMPVVEFRGRLWMIGGRCQDRKFNDIWSSANGTDWRCDVERAPFPPMEHHGCVVFKGRMYVIGFDNVWSSEDGLTWTRMPDLPFPMVCAFGLVVHNDRMVLIGGWDGGRHSTNVWASSDGAQWTMLANDCGFGSRQDLECLVFDGRIYVVGGMTNGTDIYSSADGVHWEVAAGPLPFSQLGNMGLVHYKRRIIVIGGETSLYAGMQNGVYASSVDDPSHWHEVDIPAAFRPRSRMSAIVFHEAIWMFGGRFSGDSYSDEIWVAQERCFTTGYSHCISPFY